MPFFFRKTQEDSEGRVLTAVGMCAVACLAATAILALVNPFQSANPDQLSIVIETPYVGEGVKAGTPFLLDGVKVGEVTQVTSMPTGGCRLTANLQRGPTFGLTNTLRIDFRPANYFGVSGVNLRAGDGGQALTNGSLIKTTPMGNFTLQTMLSRLGDLSHGVLTPQLISVIEKATNYIDGLDPLLETMVIVSESLTNVQTVTTARLLTNATGISVAFPGFVHATSSFGESFHKEFDDYSEDAFNNVVSPGGKQTLTALFGRAGTLLTSHSTDLAPMLDMIKLVTDTIPGLVPPDAIADTAAELRMRLEKLFSGPPDRRAVSVRVVLDSLPGIAAPLAAQGVAP